MKRHLFIPSKINYVRGKRPEVDCILCAITAHDKRVVDSTVFHNDLMTITLNIYPYNPGHLMIFPNRHIEDLTELSGEEVSEMHRLTVLAVNILKKLYHPQGFNIGYNLGESSGASVKHLHRHIVPRYKSELGFVDILAGSKIYVEDPLRVLTILKEAFQKAENKKE
ncbi:MAG: HIT domain-containing protein [Candidatus Atribacteria bacterium]|nr:HIT domain-containing protein [Candidatus Atribacteria bacterium]